MFAIFLFLQHLKKFILYLKNFSYFFVILNTSIKILKYFLKKLSQNLFFKKNLHELVRLVPGEPSQQAAPRLPPTGETCCVRPSSPPSPATDYARHAQVRAWAVLARPICDPQAMGQNPKIIITISSALQNVISVQCHIQKILK